MDDIAHAIGALIGGTMRGQAETIARDPVVSLIVLAVVVPGVWLWSRRALHR